MRIRTIKPEFFTHEALFDLEMESGLPVRIAFAGLWCAADREGRFKWEPRRLGVLILPYDGIDFSRVLDALATRGFVVNYASNGVEYGCIPSFSRHQVINNRERESEFPSPSESSILTREPRVSHATSTPLDPALAEGKGREQGTGNTPKPPKSKLPTSEPAIRISNLYRRRLTTPWSDKEIKAFKAIGEIDLEDLSILESYYAVEMAKPDGRHRRDICTLLNNFQSEVDRARNANLTFQPEPEYHTVL